MILNFTHSNLRITFYNVNNSQDLVICYLVGLIAVPSLVIFLFHIWHLIKKSDKLEIYCHNTSNPTLIRTCAGIFPIHFAILEQWYLQMKIESIMNKDKFPDLVKPLQTRLKDVRQVYTEVNFRLFFLSKLDSEYFNYFSRATEYVTDLD